MRDCSDFGRNLIHHFDILREPLLRSRCQFLFLARNRGLVHRHSGQKLANTVVESKRKATLFVVSQSATIWR